MRRARRWMVAVLACACVGTLASCNRKQLPNIVVVVVDSLRADRLGTYGNQRGLTPFLDQLAQRGTVFVNAFAPTSSTLAATASLMSSRDPRQHLVAQLGSQLAVREKTFAEALQAHGYRNAGFIANHALQERRGLAQGFTMWRSDNSPLNGLPAAKLRISGLEWLTNNPSSQATLLYFHFMGPSQPYEAPEPFRGRFVQPPATDEDLRRTLVEVITNRNAETLAAAQRLTGQLYDAEVAAVDDQLRQLFDELTQKGFLDNALIILTSNHGEELFEHGEAGHGRTLFDESIRIPLIVIAPGFVGGKRIEENVSLVDVAPTLLDLVGMETERNFEGQSLVPLLEPDAALKREWSRAVNRQQTGVPRDLLFYLEFDGLGQDQRRHTAGIRRWTQKLLLNRNGRHEVYDLAKDPNEQTPNAPGTEGVADLLEQGLTNGTRFLQQRALLR